MSPETETAAPSQSNGAAHAELAGTGRRDRAIGARLYHRSSPGHPMRPTARGNALLQALDHPAVRALAPRQDASQRTGQDRPPY